jgi:hypothetical protein
VREVMSRGVGTLESIGPSKFSQSKNKGKILSNAVLLKFIYSEKAIKLCKSSPYFCPM